MKENNNKTGKRLWLIMMAGGILYILLTLYEKAIHPWYKPELLIFIPMVCVMFGASGMLYLAKRKGIKVL